MIILYSKSMRLFMGSEFFVSHTGSTNSDTFTAFHRWGLCLTIIYRFFTRWGIYSFLLIPSTYFPFHATVQLCWTLSHLPSSPNQTPNAVSIYQPCTHTHEMRCFPCICNAKCHCMLAHVTCIIHYMEQFINRTLCQIPWIIISKAYNLHPFMLIYITPMYQHIYNTFSML